MKKIIFGLKIVGISVLCSEIMMLLHQITLLEDIETIELSWLANHYGAKTAAFLWGIVAYCIVSVVFVVIEKESKSSHIRNTLLFGGLTGWTWWFGMIEIDQTFNNVIMGLVDGIMVTMVCILTAYFVCPRHELVIKSDSVKEKYKNNVIEILIVSTIFALNRLFFGLFLGKYFNSTLDYILIPLNSLFLGLMWIKLRDMVGSGTLLKKALKYGVIIWGLPSSIFMYFLAFLFKGMFIGMTIRNIFDVVFMTLAVWLAMKFRKSHETSIF